MKMRKSYQVRKQVWGMCVCVWGGGNASHTPYLSKFMQRGRFQQGGVVS